MNKFFRNLLGLPDIPKKIPTDQNQEIIEARAAARFAIATKGAKPTHVQIDKIPESFETFPNSNDKWARVDFPEEVDYSACVYEFKKDGFFNAHYHPGRLEHIVMLTPGTSLTIYTLTKNFTLEYPNAYLFDRGEVHAVKPNQDLKILCMWQPKFETGWAAEFPETT